MINGTSTNLTTSILTFKKTQTASWHRISGRQYNHPPAGPTLTRYSCVKKKLISIIAILIIAIIGLGTFIIIQTKANNVSANSPEGQELIGVLSNASKATYDAIVHGDVSGMDMVYVDLPDEVNYSTNTKKLIEGVYGPEVARHAGYLTYQKAKYISWGNVGKKLKELQAKAASEKRNLTPDEWKEVEKAGNNQVLPYFYGADKPWKGIGNLIYHRIEITGDRAVIEYETSLSVEEAYFVRINNQWYIYKVKVLKSTF